VRNIFCKLKYENKNKKYYPDLYIVSENKIIEVKSKYTYETNITLNTLKRKASIGMGLSFEFWVYDSAGKRITA
jgi:hypothetical protein